MNILLNIFLFTLIVLSIQANIFLFKRIFNKIVILRKEKKEEKGETINISDVAEVDLSGAKEMLGADLDKIKLKVKE